MSMFKEVIIMELKANVNFDRFESALQVVDSHTVGEFCRIVIGGFPEPEGSTMIEKKKWMEDNYDHVRTALMFEPRGHHDMFRYPPVSMNITPNCASGFTGSQRKAPNIS